MGERERERGGGEVTKRKGVRELIDFPCTVCTTFALILSETGEPVRY